jgi:hypothetical protein
MYDEAVPKPQVLEQPPITKQCALIIKKNFPKSVRSVK